MMMAVFIVLFFVLLAEFLFQVLAEEVVERD
jgi:hypothetical protein